MPIENVAIDTADGVAEAYLARPDATPTTDRPGVLLYMDAFGLRPQIATMMQRIADWGCVVLAPNAFYRGGSIADIAPTGDLHDPEARQAAFESIGPLLRSHTSEQAATDADAYLAALSTYSQGSLSTVGYCMGGRLALRAAAQHPEQVQSVSMFHVGGLVTDASDSPHLGIPNLRARVLAGYADNDRSMTPDAVATVDRMLEEAGIAHDTSIRPGAPHGYTMADTSSYDEAAAQWHFTRLREWLQG
ncbi:dienelactone hydrolase family protein [uncultured Microbacterium sp.]|uniref:dienelactone hydrolase family protein n=1 Tax=uncultured Microbacterium sp. TaxID=191216 RepID=UPI0026387FAD|nr:dienelactone hydrolase family protein [uncultured Microbacterium sp.]